MPCQLDTSNPGTPDSAMVGTSGAAAARFAVDTPSARSLPLFTCGSAGGMVLKTRCTRPETRSVMIAVAPL